MKRYIDAGPYKDCKIVLHSEDVGVPIKCIPTADVEEVRHGKWIVTNYGNHSIARCSACGEEFYYFNKGQYHIDHSTYCPKCGAIMD